MNNLTKITTRLVEAATRRNGLPEDMMIAKAKSAAEFILKECGAPEPDISETEDAFQRGVQKGRCLAAHGKGVSRGFDIEGLGHKGLGLDTADDPPPAAGPGLREAAEALLYRFEDKPMGMDLKYELITLRTALARVDEREGLVEAVVDAGQGILDVCDRCTIPKQAFSNIERLSIAINEFYASKRKAAREGGTDVPNHQG